MLVVLTLRSVLITLGRNRRVRSWVHAKQRNCCFTYDNAHSQRSQRCSGVSKFEQKMLRRDDDHSKIVAERRRRYPGNAAEYRIPAFRGNGTAGLVTAVWLHFGGIHSTAYFRSFRIRRPRCRRRACPGDPELRTQSEQNRGGRDKPGRHAVGWGN